MMINKKICSLTFFSLTNCILFCQRYFLRKIPHWINNDLKGYTYKNYIKKKEPHTYITMDCIWLEHNGVC